MSALDLSGRTALITGAARGIGLETARGLHRRGATVALVDLDQGGAAAAAAELGDRAFGLAADVTDRAAVDRAVAEAVERCGGLDVVVANAGIAHPPATARVLDEATFERVLDVNLLGVWRTVRAALPHVVERRGNITVVASVYAFTNGLGQLPYATAKAGVEQLGRGLRTELAQHGVNVTVAYFGFIDTEMVRGNLDRSPHADRLGEMIPVALRKRLPPSAAGEGVAAAIAAGRPSVMLPRRWRALSAIRGLNPLLDRAVARDERVRALLAELDRPPVDGI